ncbi:PREDICTED: PLASMODESMATA CALLOSE-BINDING PROTEIN 3-like [Populus euphratica]|uniref:PLASMODESMATA CALLOSE-BINDING PROTEIN 3-like n=1 Tax=Populus euphratica TaxID=75702 RepID=A0AAJ6VDQ0_POPEU|nr:PREDICTED: PLASMODESMATA CALLOSE-BINDING PROTEIN 3-like [Populus euphratica]XP_011045647.1 PREDICTED: PLASMODESMATA CALLOSE-BINDING PROTEIN 3-like [Populus euphratica]
MAKVLPNKLLFVFFAIHVLGSAVFLPAVVEGGTWCVARSDASNQALQAALDYACASGADCTPIQSSGLCFLPNTIQAHASYAFNSYFQRKAMAPGSCDFSGTASASKSDPSYGSCMYPSSLSTAGGTGTTTSTTPAANPSFQTPPSSGGTTGLNPGNTPLLDNSKASLGFMVNVTLLPLCLLLVFSFTFRPM